MRPVPDRRRFLVRFGGGVASVVLLGACSSSDDATDSVTGTTTTGAPDDGPQTTAPVAEEPQTAREASSDELSWQEVSFGFVSAYLLQRGREVAIVDTGTGTTEEFESGLEALDASWNDVADVILTHSHGDHIGGLGAVIERAPGARAHAGVGDLEAIAAGGFDAELITGVVDGDEVFGLEIISTPGHTPGHISVFDAGTGLLVAGDAVNISGGAITGPNPDFTADMETANTSVAKLLEGRDISTALVGHGAPLIDGAGESLAALIASLG